jgi:archaellum biogenesis ATPase FlaH
VEGLSPGGLSNLDELDRPHRERRFMTNEFLNDLFGDQDGIVYSPVKGEGWKQHFFEWPLERDKLEAHVSDFNKRDVYVSPVLFNERRIAPETFKGTNYLWTEFDGVVPTGAIEPTMRIMSSQEGHEHWYWKLDHFETDKVLIEDLTRRIAYHYGADLSVWDYQNVLRPVDTWNHKRNKPVTLVDKNTSVYSINDFLWVPIPPAGTKVSISLGTLPVKDQILAKYKWTYDALDLLFKEVATGKRSDALTRLAYECVEAGCSNEEIYVLLEDRDRVWGKYVDRSDRQKRLESFISYVRGKKLITAEIVQGTTEVYRFHDFMHTNVTLKWAIEGLLPVAGSMVIFGKPGIGKSTFSLRLAMALSLGDEHFLNWKIINRQKTLFISLEMQHDELKEFFSDMKLTEEKQELLQEWFHIWPIGHAYPFDTPDQQIELLKFIDMHKIELIIIDSLSLSMYGAVKDDDAVKRLNSFLNEDVRKDRKCGYIFIHHPRKDGVEVKKDKDQDDSFGSMYITANAQTVVLLSQKPGSSRMNVKMLKTRMSRGAKEFEIERTPDRGFTLVGSIVSTPVIEGGKTSPDKEPEDGSLGKLFGL